MKKLLTGFFFLSFVFSIKAQNVLINDLNFVSWLQVNVPSAMSGQMLDTTDAAVTTRTVAIITNQSISNLMGIRYFDSLKVLDCSSNALSFIPTLPGKLRTLICNNNTISTWPVFPYSLWTLKFKSNQQFNMPSLPPYIKVLDFSSNLFASAPALPNTLDTLICQSSQLVNFVIPNNVIYFDCSGNAINGFASFPNTLRYLNCSGGAMTSFPPLPAALEFLDCTFVPITSLPPLPNGLKQLICIYNQLTSIPAPLPDSLLALSCFHNQITSIPALPNKLQLLQCYENQISALPALPNSLSTLECSSNQISSLPTLPASLKWLNCYGNNISCFDPFNPGLSVISILNNPFSCLPNYVWAMDTATLAYPLCVAGNPGFCPVATGINGFTYKDVNGNCTKNSGDAYVKNIPIKIYDNLGNLITQNYSAINGIYSFTQTANSYNIVVDTVNKPYMPQCTYPGIDSMVTTTGLLSNINFALTSKPGFDVGVQSVRTNGWIFPGQVHQLSIVAGDMGYWYNLGCASGISGQVKVTVTGNVTYIAPVSGALTPSITGNVYTYTVADFGTINSISQFRLLFSTNTNAQSGDTICVHIDVTPLSGDNKMSNNSYDFCYNVVNSYDPNLKEVYPIDVQPGFQDWLTYTIHFQNTGTAPAINIKVTDTLDSNLDLSTFEMIYYSHYNSTELKNNVLTFNFPDIYLSDSTSDAPKSKAIVQYRIKPKPGLPTGTQIKNRANIFFDYNPPIITNTTINNFVSPLTTSVNELKLNSLMVYPNPARNSLTIIASEDIIQVNMYNILGELALHINTKNKQEQIDISKLNSGIYFMEIKTKGEVYTTKIIKEN